MSESFDIAVVGGGAAGAMAAIRAAELGKMVILIERNDSIGKKILITGKGRCNITNSAPIETFIEKFGTSGKFLRTALYKFFNGDLIEFFNSCGLEMKVERQGRVFPSDDKARSVVEALVRRLIDLGVKIVYSARLTSIKIDKEYFKLEIGTERTISAKKVILATGGASYRATGSSGDGFVIAEKMGHKIIKLKPGLVPLTTNQEWVKDLQGLALENIRITFEAGKKKLVSEIGELMFTHFGISGPLVLDLSGDVMDMVEAHKAVNVFIDLKPALTSEQLDNRLLREFQTDQESRFQLPLSVSG